MTDQAHLSSQPTPEQVQARQESKRQQVEQKREEAGKLLDEQAKAATKAEEKTLKMMAAKPTPTQREIDLAALGVPVLEKEASGAPKAHPKTGAPMSEEEEKELQKAT